MIATQVDGYKLFHEGILALGRAERQGIRIDLDYCRAAEKDITKQITALKKELHNTKFYRHWKHSIGGKKPNINSNTQLAHFLYNVKKLKATKTTASGKGSTDEEALESLGIPEVRILLKIRKLRKIKDTYLNGFLKEQVDGYIHPFFNLHIPRTFRSSSQNPNFQNIPKRDKEAREIIRKALYPRPGYQLLEVDYGGIEVAISACYHKDPQMIKYIEDPTTDMHGDMAKQIFMIDHFDRKLPGHNILRAGAKNGFVFPQFYGDYYGNNAVSLAGWAELPEKGTWKSGQGIEHEDGLFISDHLIKKGIKNLSGFTEHLKKIEDDFWNNRFRVYNRWKLRQWKKYERDTYVDMLTGFRCLGPMDRKEVTNYPIQGTAFHCLLWSFVRLDRIIRKRKMKTRLIGQIHDAIIADVHPAERDYFCELLHKVMTQDIRKAWPWIIVPLTIEIDMGGIDESWNELKPIAV